MAHTSTYQELNESPEEGIHRIQQERTRKAILAAVLGLIAVIAVVASAYLSYRDVPAPASPANAHSVPVEPYH